MRVQARRILLMISILVTTMLVSCDLSEPIFLDSTKSSEPIRYSSTDIQNAESCWLKSFDLSFGDWSHEGGECTSLARELTTAPGYGREADGSLRGGIDYIRLQQYSGNPLPLLSETKTELKSCDVLILTSKEYLPAGHTVVVFYIDLPDDQIYILEQNYPTGSPISQRALKISDIEDSTYVVQDSACRKPLCSMESASGPIIAVPESPVPAIEFTIEVGNSPSIEGAYNSSILNNNNELSETSPSKRGKIAYEADLQIFVMNDDGSNPIQLTDNSESCYNPNWSPDRQKIAFNSHRDGETQIYVMNADGGNQTKITSKVNGSSAPAWSPDGQKIAFTPNRGTSQIFVVNPDGSNLLQLTDDQLGSYFGCWSPDGRRIAYVSGSYELLVMNSDGSNKQHLSDIFPDFGNTERLTCAWSPDGEKIAFPSVDHTDTDIFVINVDGSALERLSDTEYDDYFPAWSPDGNKIAFGANINGKEKICRMNADGSGQVCLPNDKYNYRRPVWSPNSEKIAFSSDRDGHWEIYVMNVYGDEMTRLTNHPYKNGGPFDPVWSP